MYFSIFFGPQNPNHNPSNPSSVIGLQFFGNGAGGGLTGHNCYTAIDFRSTDFGNDDQAEMTWSFKHNCTKAVPICLLGFGDRGGCTLGSRVMPRLTFDFNNCPWNYSEIVSYRWRTSQNQLGRSFAVREVKRYRDADITPLLGGNEAGNDDNNKRITWRSGSTMDVNSDKQDETDIEKGLKNYNGGFTSIWKFFEYKLNVYQSGNANYKKYIMLINTDESPQFFTQSSGTQADRSLDAYDDL